MPETRPYGAGRTTYKPLTPQKSERIASMFVRGYSLDLVAEWGLQNGWSREQAKEVVEARGWALDWAGRLQDRYLKREKVEEAVLPRTVIGEADIERMIAVGLDHELTEIRRTAVKAQRACDELRRALVIQEEKDAEEVCSRRQIRDAEAADPTRIPHGSWGGYLMHKRLIRMGVEGAEVCEKCEQARVEYRERMWPERTGQAAS